MTRRVLHLHIGAHRTGTSSIQSFMAGNVGALLARGYLYPYGVKRHDALMRRLFDGRLDADAVAADLGAIADAKARPVEHIVLSDEDICTRPDLSPLAGLARHFDLRVIYAMRRQDLWLESWYLQNVKWQWQPHLAHLTFPDFLARREEFFWIRYDEMARRLEETFGAESVRLLVFEKGRADPVAALRDALEIPRPEGLRPVPAANMSLSPVMSEFMRTLPLDRMPPRHRHLVERACAQADSERRKAEGHGPRLLMDHATRIAVLDEYAAGNAALAGRRFGRTALFTEPVPVPAAPLATLALPQDSYAAMDRLVGPTLAALVALCEEEWRGTKERAAPAGQPAGRVTAGTAGAPDRAGPGPGAAEGASG